MVSVIHSQRRLPKVFPWWLIEEAGNRHRPGTLMNRIMSSILESFGQACYLWVTHSFELLFVFLHLNCLPALQAGSGSAA